MVIGIIGKIGSGKSACAQYIKNNYDAYVFSCDDIAKDLIEKKEVDYELGDPVDFFTNPEKQELCRKVVHKAVFEKIDKLLKEYKDNDLQKGLDNRLYIIESALPSKTMLDMCDKTIYIECPYEKIKAQLEKERLYSGGKTKLIYDSQKYYEKYYDMADIKIKNDFTLDNLLKKIKEVVDEICVICK